MDLAREYGIDAEKERNGVWHVIRGGRFLLRPTNNPQWREQVFRQFRQAGRRLRSDEQDLRTAELLADTVVVDWDSDPKSETCIMENGKPIPFSKDAAKRLFLKYRGLMDDIVDRASDQEAYQNEVDKEIQKN